MPVTGSKFVIVGGAGLVGSALGRELARNAGTDVVVCDRLGGADDGRWHTLPASLDDLWAPEDLAGRLDRSWRDIAGVVVLADGCSHSDLFETSFTLPRRLWDFAAQRQRPLYWGSSLQIYGTGGDRDGPASSLTPVSGFGRAKQAFEVFAERHSKDADAPPVATAFRLASVYGSGESHKGSRSSLPAQALQALKAGNPVQLWRSTDPAQVDGGHARDWVHVDDAAAMMAAVMLAGLQGPFDIGSGTLTSALDVVRTAASVADTTPSVTFVEPEAGASLEQGPAADGAALKAAGINVSPRSLASGLRELSGQY
jgi:nucleoside-diphosphate-sugar epimerase